jgi:hypothetical protein
VAKDVVFIAEGVRVEGQVERKAAIVENLFQGRRCAVLGKNRAAAAPERDGRAQADADFPP